LAQRRAERLPGAVHQLEHALVRNHVEDHERRAALTGLLPNVLNRGKWPAN
jgi:hypothetical protein